jgi:hypothetical protein
MKSKKTIKNLIKYNIEQLKTNDEWWGSEENISIDLLITHHFNKNKIYEKWFVNFDDWNSHITCFHYDSIEISEMLLEMLKGTFKFSQNEIDVVAIDTMVYFDEKYGLEDDKLSLEEYVHKNWDVLSKEERERCFNICQRKEIKF